MKVKKSERYQFEIDIAKMYFLDKLTQKEISKKLFISRSNVSRIIKRCIDKNIVEITIRDPSTLYPEIAHKLQKKYDLKAVIIGPSSKDSEGTLASLADLIAAYIMRNISNGMILGIANGKVGYYTAQSLKNEKSIKADVVQIVGAISNIITKEDLTNTVLTMSNKLHGTGYLLRAPFIVKTTQIKQFLKSNRLIADVYQKFNQLDMVLVEIEELKAKYGTQFKEPWMTKADSIQLRELGAVAGVCGHYFDLEGLFCGAGISNRLIGIGLNTLQKVPIKIGVAYGDNMLNQTISILRSKVINTLAIDEVLAHKLNEIKL